MRLTLATLLLALGTPVTLVTGAGTRELPESYVHFGLMAEDLVAPLVPLMDPDRSNFPIEGPPSDHGKMADELEAFTRPGLLLALWLQMEPLPESARKHHFTREQVAAWYRQAMLNGTNPEHPAYWGHLMNYHQHGVEMSILTMSLAVARDQLWDPLTQAEKDQVADWLGEIRGNARYWNNHLYFAILTIEFLRSVGYEEPGDQAAIDFMFQLLEGMHVAGGWFKDGTNESYDHYNAYAFHTYGLWWSWKFGHTNPERAARWRAWTEQFLPDYAHFFAASGEHLPYGRSITYRFNSLGVFGLAPEVGLEPIPYGEMRRICRKNLEFFLSHPITQEQGCLSVGWTDEFHGVAEPYTCAGSPYWAAKGLFMLAIPPDHPFWTVPEEKYPAERGDFTRLIEGPRFLLKGVHGEVELLNAGSQVSRSGSRYGTWKWSKIAYRTGLGFLLTPDFDLYPFDAQITAVPRGFTKRFGRRATIALAAEPDHIAYIYALGQRNDGVNFNAPIRTDVYPKDEWVLAVHRVRTFVPARFYHGSFAAGSDDNHFEKITDGPGYALAGDGKIFSAVQNVAGFDGGVIWDERLDQTTPRRHLTSEYHVTPVLQTEDIEGRAVLAVLFWAGKDRATGVPWVVKSAGEGHWSLSHPVLGKWEVSDPNLPALPGN